MRVTEPGKRPGASIDRFASSGVEYLGAVPFEGPGALTFLYFHAEGHLGRHPTLVEQTLCVVEGHGWVIGGDGGVVHLTTGQAAVWEPGEERESGTDSGMTVAVLESAQTMSAGSAPAWLVGFQQAIGLGLETAGLPAVSRRWAEPSSLEGMSIGGVVAHMYAGLRRFEAALDEPLPSEPRMLAVGEFYGLNRIDDRADLDSGWHPLLRSDAEKRAGQGPDTTIERLEAVSRRLRERIPGEAADRLVGVWTVPNGVTSLPVYVATRVVELVVHADDLAASGGIEVPIPQAAATTAVEVFTELARQRSGDVEVIRAFARGERASAEVLRVL